MKFSQRIGKTSIRNSLQIDDIDEILKNRLWNTIQQDFLQKLTDDNSIQIYKLIWTEFFTNPIDEFPSGLYGNYIPQNNDYLKEWFYSTEWYKIYDFIEFIAFIDSQIDYTKFIDNCNNSLEREVAGFRIVDKIIVQITSEDEIKEIESALKISTRWGPVNKHLETALKYLADRKTPDYRNSIKESISAIESFCKIITGDNKTTLGKALKQIEQKWEIHKSLKNAFSSLYGYTSDESGIRHSLLENGQEITFEDAKFMMVSCSAFINYLKIKIDK